MVVYLHISAMVVPMEIYPSATGRAEEGATARPLRETVENMLDVRLVIVIGDSVEIYTHTVKRIELNGDVVADADAMSQKREESYSLTIEAKSVSYRVAKWNVLSLEVKV